MCLTHSDDAVLQKLLPPHGPDSEPWRITSNLSLTFNWLLLKLTSCDQMIISLEMRHDANR